jgi:hypothetical protein
MDFIFLGDIILDLPKFRDVSLLSTNEDIRRYVEGDGDRFQRFDRALTFAGFDLGQLGFADPRPPGEFLLGQVTLNAPELHR